MIKQVMKNFFHQNRVFLIGTVFGFGIGLLAVEAFSAGTHPWLNVASIWSIVLGSILYRFFGKNNDAPIIGGDQKPDRPTESPSEKHS